MEAFSSEICLDHENHPYQQLSPRSPRNTHQHQTSKNVWNRIRRNQLKFGITILLSLFSALYVTQKRTRRTESLMSPKKSTKTTAFQLKDTGEHDLLYQCPLRGRIVAENDIEAPMEQKLWYDSVSSTITNVSSYMETFRQVEFDNWGHTYDEVKHGMFSWKSHAFRDLKSNHIIYESACGIGMNLFMTLEILQQISGITNVTIYGNDYVSRSVQVAHGVYSPANTHLLPTSFGQLGSMCEADSTQLDFIPSNSFDLVYTGYISPLFDPLHLNQSTTDENFVQYNSYCEEQSTMAEQAQARQNDWYGKWVGEMVRIAKPGAPIIIEQVSYPLCDAIFDWGGVAPTFWKDAIKSYDWDVNRSSVEMEADTLFRKRYHVYMRKKVLRTKKTNIEE